MLDWDLENLVLFHDVIECSLGTCPFCMHIVQAPGSGGWGVSSCQQLLPISGSCSPAVPAAQWRVKVAGHPTGGGTQVTFVLQRHAPGSCAYFRVIFFYFFTWYKRRRLTAMTHSLFPRLLRQSCFSQLQSQVILNNSPAALAHTNVISPLASWPYCFILHFQRVNAFFPLQPPLPVAPGARVVYSSAGIHHCAPVATAALVFTLPPATDSRHPGRFEQDQLRCHPASCLESAVMFEAVVGEPLVRAGTGHWAVCTWQWDEQAAESTAIKQHILFPATGNIFIDCKTSFPSNGCPLSWFSTCGADSLKSCLFYR